MAPYKLLLLIIFGIFRVRSQQCDLTASLQCMASFSSIPKFQISAYTDEFKGSPKTLVQEMCLKLKELYDCVGDKLLGCAPQYRLIYETAVSSGRFVCGIGKQGFIDHFRCLTTQTMKNNSFRCGGRIISVIREIFSNPTSVLTDLASKADELCINSNDTLKCVVKSTSGQCGTGAASYVQQYMDASVSPLRSFFSCVGEVKEPYKTSFVNVEPKQNTEYPSIPQTEKIFGSETRLITSKPTQNAVTNQISLTEQDSLNTMPKPNQALFSRRESIRGKVLTESKNVLETVLPEQEQRVEPKPSIPEQEPTSEPEPVFPEQEPTSKPEPVISEQEPTSEPEPMIPKKELIGEPEPVIPEKEPTSEPELTIPEEKPMSEPEPAIPEQELTGEPEPAIPEQEPTSEPVAEKTKTVNSKVILKVGKQQDVDTTNQNSVEPSKRGTERISSPKAVNGLIDHKKRNISSVRIKEPENVLQTKQPATKPDSVTPFFTKKQRNMVFPDSISKTETSPKERVSNNGQKDQSTINESVPKILRVRVPIRFQRLSSTTTTTTIAPLVTATVSQTCKKFCFRFRDSSLFTSIQKQRYDLLCDRTCSAGSCQTSVCTMNCGCPRKLVCTYTGQRRRWAGDGWCNNLCRQRSPLCRQTQCRCQYA
ncbi:proteoglycan 4-like [Saccostrea cucullata]|uniref:proteoglycan 4-like n=1 Tax=Saccostrea cuccullata TaxID=36930 RepID=UPI002ED2A258